MRKEYDRIMAEVITTGEPLRNVLILAPRGTDDDDQALELLIEGRNICPAFTDLSKAALFTVALVKKGIDMRGFDPFIMESLPIKTGVWLDPSAEALREMSVLNLIHRDN